MLGRRKHKRIQIERMADRKRQRAPERTAEQVAMTRRTFLFKGLAAASFVALTGRLWQLQVVHRNEIADEGVAFTQRFFPLKAARGMIYDRQRQLLADNKKRWDVTIVPANLPDDEDEQDAIFATLARSLGMGDVAVVEPKKLLKEGRDESYARLAAALGVPLEKVRDPVEGELRDAAAAKRAPQAAVRVSDELPPDRAAAVRAAARDLPGVQVMNAIKYQVAGTYDIYVPLVVKKDIPKPVALGIEANRLYLPGVQIDDQALSRRYSVGEDAAMGHILGYTGPITREEYDKAVVLDEQGRPLLDDAGRKVSRYAFDDPIGKAGLEAALEDLLRGQSGGYMAKVNARGQLVDEYTQYRRNPVHGKSVVLTVSVDFQREVIAHLQAGIERAKATIEEKNAELRAQGKKQHPAPPGAGAAIVLNPQTGEVLAMVSLPGYDQRHFAEGISQQQFDAYLETNVPPEQRRFPLQNRCVANQFAPGSTIKPFMAAAGLQESLLTPDTKLKCLGHIEVPSTWDELTTNTYWCWTRDASHQDLNVTQALAVSCDVFFYSVGAPAQKDERGTMLHYYQPGDPNPTYFGGLGIDKINQYLNLFGFGARSGVELANEVEGLIPGARWKEETFPGDFWSVGDTINTSIGQGYHSVTPLQLCNATAAIGNGGTLYRPTLVREVLDGDGKAVASFKPQVLRKLPVDRRHLEIVRQGMLMNVTDPRGLVSHAPADNSPDRFPLPPGVTAGVKTGTAEYGTEFDEEGLSLRAHAWTVAFAPFDNPQICVCAFVEGGSASATVAAPIASGIISAYFTRFGGQP